jgi:hypothetical protein
MGISCHDGFVTLITDIVAPIFYVSESQTTVLESGSASFKAENVMMFKLEVAVIALRLQQETWLKPQGPSGR